MIHEAIDEPQRQQPRRQYSMPDQSIFVTAAAP
jgi:hypothetical protein